MKAVIMAGGEGRRLRPLTDRLPKPLLPVAGIPAINRILMLLARHGITEAAVTTGYLADKIETALGPRAEGVGLTYFREETPLGTAGGVAAARAFIGKEDFVVISGDSVSETDLTAAAAFRRDKNAMALLILTRAADPGEYGVVLCDGGGRILGFSEKPSLSGTYSDTVNTGIYLFSPAILDRIPAGPCDFGRDLFPALLASGEPLYGLVDENYWCDIGDAEAYRLANLRLTGGDNAAGRNCRLPRTGVSGSVLLDNVTVGEDCLIEDAVLCENVTVGAGTRIGPGSLIGYDSIIGEGSVLDAGTVLPSGSRVPAGTALRTGFPGGVPSPADLLDGSGIRCRADRMSVSLAVRIGLALAGAAGEGRIGLLRDERPESGPVAAALLRGLRSQGNEILLLGSGFAAAASYAPGVLGLSLCLFLALDDEGFRILLFDRSGLYPVRDFERSLSRALKQGVQAKPKTSPPVVEIPFVERYYLPMLTYRRCALEGFAVSIGSDNAPSRLLTRAVLSLGGRIVPHGGLRCSLSDDGFLLSVEQDGCRLDDWHSKALLLKYLIRGRVALPASSPEALRDLCRERCLIYTHCPSGQEEAEARAASVWHPELRHGAAAALELIGLLTVSGRSLRELSRHLPHFATRTADVLTERAGRLGILPFLGDPDGDGIVAGYARGNVRVIASRTGFRLMAEAVSGEYAEEILELSEKEINRLLKEGAKKTPPR